MKYCSTLRPSRKLAVMGVSMISPEGLAIKPRIPESWRIDRKSTRLNSSHLVISYAVFCLKKITDGVPSRAWHCATRWTPPAERERLSRAGEECPRTVPFQGALDPPFFFFNDTATTEIYTLSLHDALPI